MSAPERSVHDAVGAAVTWLRDRQDADGWWKGELRSNVSIEAEDLLLRQFLGIRTEAETAATARWIRVQQRADGTWANFPGGPAELSTTVEAYVALRLAGDAPGSPHLSAAASFIREHGGIPATRVFTRIWLALFGVTRWEDLPALPPEVMLLPRWAPLNIYDFACWARQTIVPLTIVAAHRPVRPLGVDLDELGPATGRREPAGIPLVMRLLDRALRAYEQRPVRLLRRVALRRAGNWVAARQEADGSWGGIQPPWVYSLLALHLLDRPQDRAAFNRGLAGLDGFTVYDADTGERRLEACQSPVWDTALAVLALADAGVPGDDPALQRAGEWLLGAEVRRRGDWAVRRPRLAPGGWAFEFDNDVYPDVDDTAEVVLALRRAAVEAGPAIGRGVDWVVGMQSRDGGFGAFDADNTSTLAGALPFCDFGEVTDPPSADVTAHALEMLAAEGQSAGEPARRAVRWLLDAQEPEGSWFGRWGANHVYGTGAVVPALVAAGVGRHHISVRRAVGWLAAHQNDDGGWGEDLRSYRDPAWIGRGPSTPSQTAWALLALLAAAPRHPAVERGVDWLLRTQRPDGTWDEEPHTGTGFPGDFYLGYLLYRHLFPLTALGRYQRLLAGEHG